MFNYGDKNIRDEVARIIGADLDALELRAKIDALTEEDDEAIDKLRFLINNLSITQAAMSNIVHYCFIASRDAIKCCLAAPPADQDMDKIQQVMRFCLDIKDVLERFGHNDNG